MKVRLLALAFGFSLVAGVAYAGPTPGGLDSDTDGVEDAFDNCTTVSNTSQADADHNGCGDACTEAISCDADGDTTVGASDFFLLTSIQWEMPAPSVNSADCDGDNFVGASDFFIMTSLEWENLVGPSGITTAQCDPPTCQCTPQ